MWNALARRTWGEIMEWLPILNLVSNAMQFTLSRCALAEHCSTAVCYVHIAGKVFSARNQHIYIAEFILSIVTRWKGELYIAASAAAARTIDRIIHSTIAILRAAQRPCFPQPNVLHTEICHLNSNKGRWFLFTLPKNKFGFSWMCIWRSFYKARRTRRFLDMRFLGCFQIRIFVCWMCAHTHLQRREFSEDRDKSHGIGGIISCELLVVVVVRLCLK